MSPEREEDGRCPGCGGPTRNRHVPDGIDSFDLLWCVTMDVACMDCPGERRKADRRAQPEPERPSHGGRPMTMGEINKFASYIAARLRASRPTEDRAERYWLAGVRDTIAAVKKARPTEGGDDRSPGQGESSEDAEVAGTSAGAVPASSSEGGEHGSCPTCGSPVEVVYRATRARASTGLCRPKQEVEE